MAKAPTANIIRLPQVSDTTGDSKTLAASQRIATMAYTTASAAQTSASSAQTTANTAKTTADAAKTIADSALPKSGGTVTGKSNFTGGLQVNGVNVLKLNDYGVGTVSTTANAQNIANSGFYKYGGSSTGIVLPSDKWTKYGTFIKSAWAAGSVQSTFIMQELTQLRAAIGYVTAAGDIKTAEVITTENIASYANDPIIQNHTWLTSSRSAGTTYTNSTGAPIIVEVVLVATGSVSFEVVSDNQSVYVINSNGGSYPVSLKVERGKTYAIYISNGLIGKISSWYELR